MPQRPGLLRGYATEAVALGFVLVLLIVIVLPAYLMGAFQQVPKKGLPVIQAGKTVAYGEFSITPTDAIITTKSPGGFEDEGKKKAYLVVHARVENRYWQPVYCDEDLVDDYSLIPPGKSKPAKPGKIGLVRDHSGECTLLPHLPENLQLIWDIPITAPVPSGITMTIKKRTYQKAFWENTYQWQEPAPWLDVQLPVRQDNP